MASTMNNNKKLKKVKHKPAKPVLEPLSADLGDGDTKFSRALGSTDFLTREQGLSALSRWLTTRSDVSDLEMLRLWKGLYFCFWHSDKVPVQTDLAERLAALLPQLQPAAGHAYFSAFVATMRREWFNMDSHRINKFLMLARKFMRQMFVTLERSNWSAERITALTQQLRCGAQLLPTQEQRSAGLTYHIADCWLPELQAANGGEPVPAAAALLLLELPLTAVAAGAHQALIQRVRESVFEELLQELRDPADDEEAAATWQQLAVDQLAEEMFKRASQPEVRARNREALYALHAELERVHGKRRKAGKQQQQPLQQGQQQQQQQQQGVVAGVQASGVAAAGSSHKHKKRQLAEQAAEQQQQQQPAEPTGDAAADAAASTPQKSAAKKKRKRSSMGAGDGTAVGTPAPAAQPSPQQQRQQQQAEAPSPKTPAAAGKPLQGLTNLPNGKQQAAGKGSQSVPAKMQHAAAMNGVLTTPAAAAAGGLKKSPGSAAAAAVGPATTGKKPKRVGVVINERRNLYFAHGEPPPAAEVRTPPSAKPKGSALKKHSTLKPPATAPAAARGVKTAAGGGSSGGSRGQQQQQRRVISPASVPRPRAAAFF